MKTIALVGFGLIGKYIHERSLEENAFNVQAIMDSDESQLSSLPPELICGELPEISKLSVDVVVEAAHAKVAKALWPLLPVQADFFPIPLTCFADADSGENCHLFRK